MVLSRKSWNPKMRVCPLSLQRVYLSTTPKTLFNFSKWDIVSVTLSLGNSDFKKSTNSRRA